MQWLCRIILPFCVAQIFCSQPRPDPTMIIKTKGKRAVTEFSHGYFARNPNGRTGFLPYQSPFILKLIPLGRNADTASALKKSVLLLWLCGSKPQILCWGKHFAQNMCTVALVCRIGERQGGMERATRTHSLFQWDCLQLVSALLQALACCPASEDPVQKSCRYRSMQQKLYISHTLKAVAT